MTMKSAKLEEDVLRDVTTLKYSHNKKSISDTVKMLVKGWRNRKW